MKRVFICSPLRADTDEGYEANKVKARKYCEFAVNMGCNPFAPHIFYTQFLDDRNPAHREAGIAMGLIELESCTELWYFDPPTSGMKMEIDKATNLGIRVIFWVGGINQHLYNHQNLPST